MINHLSVAAINSCDGGLPVFKVTIFVPIPKNHIVGINRNNLSIMNAFLCSSENSCNLTLKFVCYHTYNIPHIQQKSTGFFVVYCFFFDPPPRKGLSINTLLVSVSTSGPASLFFLIGNHFSPSSEDKVCASLNLLSVVLFFLIFHHQIFCSLYKLALHVHQTKLIIIYELSF